MTLASVRRLPRLDPGWERQADVVVIGAGAAGLSAALAAAAGGRRVLLLSKATLGSGATAWAQGGLAAVVDRRDSVELHARDTLIAGAGLCDGAAVRALVAAAPVELQRLRDLGAGFDLAAGAAPGAPLALTREGGHSRARIVHAGGDASGAEVDRALTVALRESPVEVLEHVIALDALLDDRGRAVGITAARIAADGSLEPGVVRTSAVVLATGGFGQAWSTTSNPAGATGSGLALALRAGAQVRDVEFVQFHPTVLYQGEAARGQQLLITEALRGEGSVLIDAAGRLVMAGAHPDGDLAPRDIVAAAIHARLAEAPAGVGTHVFLDATGLGRSMLEERFPTVLAGCRAVGIDPVTEPIPVAPGAHYACGGVAADLSGRTSIPGLYAVGEVASTGMHGANRLASNSIPEALVTGRRAGELIVGSLEPAGIPSSVPVGVGVDPATRVSTADLMSREAGVVRSSGGLERLLDHLRAVAAPGKDTVSLDVVEATALHTVSTLVATAALQRQESRGCHRRTDFAHPRPEWQRHLTWSLDGDDLRAGATPAKAAA